VEVRRKVAGGGAGEEVGDGKVGEPGVGRVDEDLREAEGGGVEGPPVVPHGSFRPVVVYSAGVFSWIGIISNCLFDSLK
jgi:hypothetical protein